MSAVTSKRVRSNQERCKIAPKLCKSCTPAVLKIGPDDTSHRSKKLFLNEINIKKGSQDGKEDQTPRTNAVVDVAGCAVAAPPSSVQCTRARETDGVVFECYNGSRRSCCSRA